MSDSDDEKSPFLKGLHSTTSWLEFIVLPATFFGAYFAIVSFVLDIPSNQHGIYYLVGSVFFILIILVAVAYNIDKDYKTADKNRKTEISSLKLAIVDVTSKLEQNIKEKSSAYLKIAGDSFTLGQLDPYDHPPRTEPLYRVYQMWFDGIGNVLIEFTSTGRPIETWIVDKWHFERNQLQSQFLHHLDESAGSSIPFYVGDKEPYYLIFQLSSKTYGARVDFSIMTKDKVSCIALCSDIMRI